MPADPSRCTGCQTPHEQPFFHIPRLPVDVGSLCETAAAAKNAPCGEIRLDFCRHCGLIANRSYDPQRIAFRPGYQVSLLHTPTFRSYIESLATRLASRYELAGKSIFEIGCGGGEFLRLICAAGGNHGIGVDPTIADQQDEVLQGGSVRLLPGFFGPQHASQLGDFIACLSVFEDIPQPLQFLKMLREMIADRTIPLYFEVFNGQRAIRQGEVWSIHYEQCNYFSLASLRSLFERSGFEVVDAGCCYQGDQYLYVEAIPAPDAAVIPTIDSVIDVPPQIADFQRQHDDNTQLWNQRLQAWRSADKRVAVWGSGGKGISLLNAIDHPEAIDCVVDINPDRQQHFIPGSGHRVVAPAELSARRPDVVILTNVLYRDEIAADLRDMNIDCELVVA